MSDRNGTFHLSRPWLDGPAERTVVEPWLTGLSDQTLNAYAETAPVDELAEVTALTVPVLIAARRRIALAA
ncbi:hypothetical protein [Spirillospora sp. CA-294931]|uniref:hypothetical protein n=1 Tax=Spirillospora sp. CA-294931 TaxID=3240042 RepID=UPI003D8F3AB6